MKHDLLNITKFLSLILAIMLILVSCGTTAAPADINVAVIKGPTGVGMAELIDKNSEGKALNNYTFTLASGPDEIVPKVATGEVDIAAVPTNLAAVLSKKTEGKVKMLAVNTLGVLHILETANLSVPSPI